MLESDAAVVRRIFEMSAAGAALKTIAKKLNDSARGMRDIALVL